MHFYAHKKGVFCNYAVFAFDWWRKRLSIFLHFKSSGREKNLSLSLFLAFFIAQPSPSQSSHFNISKNDERTKWLSRHQSFPDNLNTISICREFPRRRRQQRRMDGNGNGME